MTSTLKLLANVRSLSGHLNNRICSEKLTLLKLPIKGGTFIHIHTVQMSVHVVYILIEKCLICFQLRESLVYVAIYVIPIIKPAQFALYTHNYTHG